MIPVTILLKKFPKFVSEVHPPEEGTIVLDDVVQNSTTELGLTWTETVETETGFSVKRSDRNQNGFAELATVAAEDEDYTNSSLYSGVYSYRIDSAGTTPTISSNIKRKLLYNFTKEYRLTGASSQYLSLPHGTDINFSRTGSWTLRIIVKFDSSMSASFAPLISKRAATGAGIQLFKNDANKVYLALIGTTQNAILVGAATMAMDTWYDIVVVYSGSPTTLKFYINGKLDTVTVSSNNLTSEAITNTAAALIGTRLNTPIYSTMQVAHVGMFDAAIGVNSVPNILWNKGVPKASSAAINCVRDYRFNSDSYSAGAYTIVGTVGANGTTVNLAGTELVDINSVMTPSPTGLTVTPESSTHLTVFWEPVAGCTYDLEVSNDGSTGWTSVETDLVDYYYHYNVGAASTQRYFRVKANGTGTESSYSSTANNTTLSSSYTDVRYYSTHKYGDNSYNFGLSVESLRVAPVSYYDSISDKTYFTYMSRAEQGYDMELYVYYYDHALSVWSEQSYVGLKSRQGQDRHPIPAVIVADDGRIIVSATDFHNGPLQMWRSDAAGNINGFTKVTELGVKCDYPEFRKFTNGDIYVLCRVYNAGSTTAGIGYFKSTDNGATWGALVDVVQYAFSTGRTYPTLPHQPNTVDRIHIFVDVRNDSGGPFPADPDKVGYWKDMGYMWSDDGLTWHNAADSYSKQVVSSGFITSAEWITNFQYMDSVGTVDAGLAIDLITPDGVPFVSHYKDNGDYVIMYYDGGWNEQVLTFPDTGLDTFTFAYQGIKTIRHIDGNTFDITGTKDGQVKRYRTVDKFLTLTLEETNVLPDLTADYERGAMTHNIYECPEPFLTYSLKVSEPTPDPTSPGAWSDIVHISI